MAGHAGPRGTVAQGEAGVAVHAAGCGEDQDRVCENGDQHQADEGAGATDERARATGQVGRSGLGQQADQATERVPPLHGATVTPAHQFR